MGIFGISFTGIQMLLKALYVLRLGYGPRYVGAYMSAGAFTFMGMSMLSGTAGRRFGTRAPLILGGVGTAVGMALLPVAEFVPSQIRSALPIVSEIVLSAGWSLLTVNAVPALAAATPRGFRTAVYGVNNAFLGLGTLVGNLLGGMLPSLFAEQLNQSLEAPEPYRWALWLSAGLSMVGLVPLGLTRPKEVANPTREREAEGTFPVLPVALMVVYACLRNAGWATGQVFCRPFMDTDLELGAFSIGLITGVGQLFAVVAALLTPRLTARYGNGWILVGSPLLIALGLLPVSLTSHWTTAAIAQGFTLVMMSAWLPAMQAFQMDLVDDQWHSLAYGAASLGMGLGFGSVSLLGGYVVETTGYPTVFLLGAIISAVSGVLMWITLRSPWMAAEQRTA
jgi:MFS family permease